MRIKIAETTKVLSNSHAEFILILVGYFCLGLISFDHFNLIRYYSTYYAYKS